MVKLMNIVNEIRLISPRALTATGIARWDDNSKKAYRVKLNDKEVFTIHRHKNHVSVYPSFNPNSLKYKKIKEFLNQKGVPFKEIFNKPDLALIQIITPEKFIKFIDYQGPSRSSLPRRNEF